MHFIYAISSHIIQFINVFNTLRPPPPHKVHSLSYVGSDIQLGALGNSYYSNYILYRNQEVLHIIGAAVSLYINLHVLRIIKALFNIIANLVTTCILRILTDIYQFHVGTMTVLVTQKAL